VDEDDIDEGCQKYVDESKIIQGSEPDSCINFINQQNLWI
jgi:hypothetical protein